MLCAVGTKPEWHYQKMFLFLHLLENVFSKRSQIEDNLKAAGIKLTPETLKRIEGILASELVTQS